jgi:serine/threonine protein phosphatase PrpC
MGAVEAVRMTTDSPLVLDHAVVSLPKAGEELCGDSVRIVKHDQATIVVLADGLGSGVKANILSTMTVRIAATLAERGLPVEDIVDTISRTLPVCKTRNLAYSTFTIVHIDAAGYARLVEFDNPPALLIRNGELVNLVRRKRRVGTHTVIEASFQLEEGDYLVLVSDGVIHAGIGGLVPLGWQWRNLADYLCRNAEAGETAYTMAHRVEKTVRHLYEGKLGDDSTVLVLRMRVPNQLTVLVGPPENPRDDAKVAHLFKQAAGNKVVCGGTTASIIAREWQAPLSVDLSSLSPDTPPSAHLPGVNLTTEGIITVSQALDHIKSNKPSNPSSLASFIA